MRSLKLTMFGCFLFSFLFFSTTFSQGFDQEKTTTESWYTYWGLGYASINYPDEMQEFVDNLKNQEGVTNLSLSLDIFGFYWHLGPKTIGGVIVNVAGERFTASGSSIDINQYTYSASAMHYLGQNFGRGLFIRGDLGIAKLVMSAGNTSISIGDTGLGILAGGGWSFDFGGTRLLLNVNYAYRGVEGEAYNTMGFTVGGLF